MSSNQDRLQHAQKMEAIGQLASGVAHDFNNVLTVIKTCAFFLEESLAEGSPEREDAIEIRRASERGAKLTRQLLTLGRHSIAHPSSVNVDEVIEEFSSIVRRLLGEVATLVIVKGKVPTVLVDPAQLEQVIMNLAINARDAMPDGGGRVTIETSTVMLADDAAALRGLRGGHYVVIGVTDTGTGMDAETQKRIFEPFFTTKDEGHGTGLGLAIVHGIVSQAGGALGVYSEVGHGTTFRIYLPVSSETVPEHVATIQSAPETLPPVTILVIEDQPEVRQVAVRALQQAGCHTIEATTAEAARRICLSENVDVALLDVVLADGRGDLLVEQLVELRPGLVPILMSGFPAGALSVKRRVLPELLPKPFTPAELRGAVDRALARKLPAEAEVAPIAQKHRVLLVDDDATFRKLVNALLVKAGFDVVTAEDGARALELLASEAFEAVVSDVQMPGLDGIELLKQVRRFDLDVPVILMSGTPDVSSATSAVEYGAFRYVAKPLDYAKFTELVRHATRVHSLARIRREAANVTGAAKHAVDRAGFEVRFERAIEGLWMAFQPIVEANGAPYGREALMRSREPTMPNPGAMLEAAQQLGRIATVGRRVRALAAAGTEAHGMLFVNLHPDDLFDSDLLDPKSALAKIAPRVVLEITERAHLAWSPELANRLARLRELGFRLAIDDIGAGYSGLTSFAEVMPEIVKLDMSLVRDVHRSKLKQRTIGALCSLCHDTGSIVVGEGVETVDERDCLVALGCDLLQGYFIGRPA